MVTQIHGKLKNPITMPFALKSAKWRPPKKIAMVCAPGSSNSPDTWILTSTVSISKKSLKSRRTVNTIDTKISKHQNDIIQKYASGLFKDVSLEFYGIKTAKIKELINVELPKIEVSGGSADYIFLLEDDTYLHFEFQTTYNKDDLTRFAGYDMRLYERDKRRIITVIIYSADVRQAETELDIGTLLYYPEKIMMYDYDGNTIYTELAAKVNDGQEITDIDMLNLILLPLMRNTIPPEELAVQSVELANKIPDIQKRDACIAATVAFASKYMDENKINELLEVLKMTNIANLLVQDAVNSTRKEMADIANLLVQDERMEIAKNALREGLSIADIARITRLDEPTVQQLQEDME